MKQQIAKLNNLRIAPRKVRLVADSLRGLTVNEAEAQLMVMPQKAKEPLLKLLHSAVANAKHNQQASSENLFIKEISVNQGQTLKRHMPRAMGRATPIHKKSSNVTLLLAEAEKPKTPRFKIVKPEKIKKREAEKIKEEKMKQKEKEEMKPAKPETSKGSGFMKKMFRRKSI